MDDSAIEICIVINHEAHRNDDGHKTMPTLLKIHEKPQTPSNKCKHKRARATQSAPFAEWENI